MFQATASEVLVLKTISELSKNNPTKSINSIYIEESELVGILRSAQNNGKHAIEGCVAKGFLQKSEKDGKTFYKITEDGFKQI